MTVAGPMIEGVRPQQEEKKIRQGARWRVRTVAGGLGHDEIGALIAALSSWRRGTSQTNPPLARFMLGMMVLGSPERLASLSP